MRTVLLALAAWLLAATAAAHTNQPMLPLTGQSEVQTLQLRDGELDLILPPVTVSGTMIAAAIS